MKYLRLATKYMILFGSIFGVVSFLAEAKDEYSKELLKSETEKNIRSKRERNKRFIKNELLDDTARFYYDGENIYPAIVINGMIFPAVVNGSRRIPGCVLAKRVVAGKFSKEENLVICDLSQSRQIGKTKVIGAKTRIKSSSSAVKNSKVSSAKNLTTKASSAKGYKKNLNKQARDQVLEVNGFISRPKFGVRAGTWARVLLPRSVSSSEIAEIELELLEDIQGIHRVIPGGTIFFARHSINPSTQRLDMQVNLMVLMDGSEYQVTATIHGASRAAGLAGAIITNSDKVASISAKRGVLEAAKSALGQSANSVAGDVAEEVLKANSRSLPPIPDFSVQVASQEALLRFGRSF